jgi:hypothetical protein
VTHRFHLTANTYSWWTTDNSPPQNGNVRLRITDVQLTVKKKKLGFILNNLHRVEKHQLENWSFPFVGLVINKSSSANRFQLDNCWKQNTGLRITNVQKYFSGIWLTDFLKSLFIPMRYKTNTAFFSIWISLKLTQSKSVMIRNLLDQKVAVETGQTLLDCKSVIKYSNISHLCELTVFFLKDKMRLSS